MGVEDYNKKQLERLREHKIAFDQEAMWVAMQKKKKRRGAFFFFTMALVALAIVFFSWIIFSKYNAKNTRNNKENTSENKLSNKTNFENERKILDSLGKITNLDSDENKIPSNPKADLDSSNDSNESKAGAATTKGSLSETDNSATKRDRTKRSLANVNVSTSNSSALKSVNRSTNTQNESSPSGDLALTTTDANSKSNSQSSQISNIAKTPKSEERRVHKHVKSTFDDLINIQPLKIYEFPYLESLEELFIDLDELAMKAPLVIEVIKKPKSRFHIGAYGGAGYLFRQAAIENEMLELDNELLEEVSAGLELKYQLTPNFFVRSGLEYWHATERDKNSTFSITNAMDISNSIVGMEQGIVIKTTSSKIFTIYQSYNIPVIFGWNTNNDKWNVFAEAGLIYNFKMERRRDESLVNIESERFRIGSQNQISPIAGIGLSFSPSNKVELFARSNWRGGQFVTLNETSASLKFGAIRTQIGVRIGI
ncbi:MAG: hypothetical protein ACJA1A_000383 [Saprospiraceae bacterium]|jgi:hypothetical protein|tara:strand:+ start:1911 stop:3359 length:1449 start_codon:yes stop_codon:yes gene_type:complete